MIRRLMALFFLLASCAASAHRILTTGYDFSVLRPAASGCPATAPNAVTRLFNNKAAANDGNHRYVVSAATKAKMIAQGWVVEGAVFCSSSVTDAALN